MSAPLQATQLVEIGSADFLLVPYSGCGQNGVVFKIFYIAK